jgi:plastocyanin
MARTLRRSVALAALLLVTLTACDNPGDEAVEERVVPSGTQTTTTPTATGSPADDTGGATELALTAENFAFSPGELVVEAGADVTIRFDNRDPVQHAFSLFPEGSEQKEEAIFLGNPVSGPDGNERYTFPAPESGEYVFLCPIHPDEMIGSLTAR